MINDVGKRRKSPIMIEAALHVRKQSTEWCRSVAAVRCPVGLKAVDADFSWRVQVPSRVAPEWFDMAIVALGLATKQCIPSVRCRLIEAPGRWLRRWYRKLVKLECCQFRSNQIVIGIDVLPVW